jgi:hypothetical protein
LFWPHWSSTSLLLLLLPPVMAALGEAWSEKSERWCWLLPWSRAGLRVAAAAAVDEDGAACAGG